mmetsp:Transcript_75998/g.137166  ORF Transcript_75998/g.137166 Transcript_75998/m.137166 type:complete len:257 (-) Transcript_75998:6-776(-)
MTASKLPRSSGFLARASSVAVTRESSRAAAWSALARACSCLNLPPAPAAFRGARSSVKALARWALAASSPRASWSPVFCWPWAVFSKSTAALKASSFSTFSPCFCLSASEAACRLSSAATDASPRLVRSPSPPFTAASAVATFSTRACSAFLRVVATISSARCWNSCRSSFITGRACCSMPCSMAVTDAGTFEISSASAISATISIATTSPLVFFEGRPAEATLLRLLGAILTGLDGQGSGLGAVVVGKQGKALEP